MTIAVGFLCTDGVTAVVKDDELREILSNYDNIKDTLSELIKERGAPDNFTFICITRNKELVG